MAERVRRADAHFFAHARVFLPAITALIVSKQITLQYINCFKELFFDKSAKLYDLTRIVYF